MQLVEQHCVSKGDPRYAIIDEAAFKSKNLYNAALYEIRQAFIHKGCYLPYNEKREGLKRLFDLIDQQEIDLVLIEDPDRLVRFGYGYLEETFRWRRVRIEVGEAPETQTPAEELVADLLSIVTVAASRLDGNRAKKVRSCVSQALKKCLKAEEADGTNSENHETPA